MPRANSKEGLGRKLAALSLGESFLHISFGKELEAIKKLIYLDWLQEKEKHTAFTFITVMDLDQLYSSSREHAVYLPGFSSSKDPRIY